MIDEDGNIYFNGTKVAHMSEDKAPAIIDSLFDANLITTEEFVRFHRLALKSSLTTTP